MHAAPNSSQSVSTSARKLSLILCREPFGRPRPAVLPGANLPPCSRSIERGSGLNRGFSCGSGLGCGLISGPALISLNSGGCSGAPFINGGRRGAFGSALGSAPGFRFLPAPGLAPPLAMAL